MGIQTFKCKKTKALFEGRPVLLFKAFERQALRKLAMLHGCKILSQLK
jgi:plasmid maintenance system killer protein